MDIADIHSHTEDFKGQFEGDEVVVRLDERADIREVIGEVVCP